MHRLFAPDSGFMRAMSTLADLVLFNLLFILCSLPVITLGASLAALYTMTFRMARHEKYRIRDFFGAFRANFKQATLIWAIMLLFLAILWVDYTFFVANLSGQLIIWVIFILMAFIWIAVFCWVFPLICQFENGLFRSVKNALLFGLAQAPRTLAMGAMLLLPFILLLLEPNLFFKLVPLWFFIWASSCAYIGALLIKPVFLPYRNV